MAHFGIDLTRHQADKFDTAFWAFVDRNSTKDLDLEIRLHAYEVNSSLHRRVVEDLRSYKLREFGLHWSQISQGAPPLGTPA